jgi:hypothetical protein
MRSARRKQPLLLVSLLLSLGGSALLGGCFLLASRGLPRHHLVEELRDLGVAIEVFALLLGGFLGCLLAIQTMAEAIVRERDQGTLGQVLISPLSTWEIIGGKLLARIGAPISWLLGLIPAAIVGALLASGRSAGLALALGFTWWVGLTWAGATWALAFSAVTKRAADASFLALLALIAAHIALAVPLWRLGDYGPVWSFVWMFAATDLLFVVGWVGLYVAHDLLDRRRRRDLEIMPDPQHPT